LVAQGRATYSTNPGSVFAPLTPIEQQGLRDILPQGQALVSVDGNLVAGSQSAATANATAIQAGLTARGLVQILTPGDIYVPGASLVIPSFTTLRLGQRTRLIQADGTQGNMLVNSFWRSPVVTLSSISDAATSPVFLGIRLVTGTTSAAHGLVVGDGVLIRGDTSRQYNGVWKVVSAPTPTTFTFYASKKTAIGSGSGSMTAEAANLDVEVTGGTIDYNGLNNQASYGLAAMATIFNKVGNLHVHDLRVINAVKYCIHPINTHNARIRNIDLHSSADGVHLHGFTLNATVENISGETGDDFVAWSSTNAGYTQYDFLNSDGSDSISMGGDALGITWRNIKPNRCGEDVLAIYPIAANAVEGILVDGLGTDQDSANCLIVIATGGTGAAAPNVKDITLRNIRGIGRSVNIQIGRTTDTNGVTIDKLDISGIYPNGTYGNAPAMIQMNKAVVNKMIVEPRSKMVFNCAAATYFISADSATTISDLSVIDYEVSTINSAAYHSALASSGALSTVKFVRPRLFGLSQLLAGAPSGNPVITIDNWYVDSTRLAWVNYSCRLEVKNGRANNSGGNALLAVYGAISAEIVAHGNDWGGSSYWLQLGTSAGDTPTVGLYFGNHASSQGTSTGINWTATAPTVRLRASDSSLPIDGAKFTSFNSGCTFYNGNAGYGAGIGLYAMGAAATTRLAA